MPKLNPILSSQLHSGRCCISVPSTQAGAMCGACAAARSKLKALPGPHANAGPPMVAMERECANDWAIKPILQGERENKRERGRALLNFDYITLGLGGTSAFSN